MMSARDKARAAMVRAYGTDHVATLDAYLDERDRAKAEAQPTYAGLNPDAPGDYRNTESIPPAPSEPWPSEDEFCDVWAEKWGIGPMYQRLTAIHERLMGEKEEAEAILARYRENRETLNAEIRRLDAVIRKQDAELDLLKSERVRVRQVIELSPSPGRFDHTAPEWFMREYEKWRTAALEKSGDSAQQADEVANDATQSTEGVSSPGTRDARRSPEMARDSESVSPDDPAGVKLYHWTAAGMILGEHRTRASWVYAPRPPRRARGGTGGGGVGWLDPHQRGDQRSTRAVAEVRP